MTSHVNDKDFSQQVEGAPLPVLVDFWAPWCGPCLMMAPTLEELSTDLEGKVKIVKLNVDENPETAAKFGIRSLPTLLLFKDGQPADSRVGSGRRKKDLAEWLESYAA